MARVSTQDLTTKEHAEYVSDALDQLLGEDIILDLVREAIEEGGDALSTIMDSLKICVENRVERNLERDTDYARLCASEDVA